MIRLRVTACLLSVCGFLALSVIGKADDPKSAPAKKTPAGLRVAGGGNSWYAENCTPYAKEAGIQGHQAVRTISQYGQRPSNDTRKRPLELAEAGEIDVFVWGHTDGLAGNGTGTIKMVNDLLEVGLKKNPDFRVFIQIPWLVADGRRFGPQDEIWKGNYEDSNLFDVQKKLDKRRKVEEAAADAVNAKFGKRVVFLVPMSDAMMELRRMIAAGKVPGITKQSAVFAEKDTMPHASTLGSALGEMCHFAAIYRMSPEGMPKTKEMNRLGSLDENQIQILQKLAWDVVSNYPHGGVTN